MKDLLVIKIGGNVIDNAGALNSFLNDFAAIQQPAILVHGGGKLATELSSKLGIATQMVDGRRITDDKTLQVVTMTYAGWVNKTITAQLQAKGCPAIGLSGADAALIPGVKRAQGAIDYGWVADLDSATINTALAVQLLTAGLCLVIAPVTASAQGQLLNVNADTVARTLAEAMSRHYNTTLIYCFEKNGLLLDVNNEASVISEINESRALELKAGGVISAGMIPKIDNAFNALKGGVGTVIIGHAKQIKELAQKQKGYGTKITA